jgi:hypothetical protein
MRGGADRGCGEPHDGQNSEKIDEIQLPPCIRVTACCSPEAIAALCGGTAADSGVRRRAHGIHKRLVAARRGDLTTPRRAPCAQSTRSQTLDRSPTEARSGFGGSTSARPSAGVPAGYSLQGAGETLWRWRWRLGPDDTGSPIPSNPAVDKPRGCSHLGHVASRAARSSDDPATSLREHLDSSSARPRLHTVRPVGPRSPRPVRPRPRPSSQPTQR